MSRKRLGRVDPKHLCEARYQAHYAAQVVAAVGETLLEPAPDTSHTALTWSEGLGGFQGHPLPDLGGLRVGVRLATLEFVVSDEEGAEQDRVPLAGSTWVEAEAGAADALGRAAGRKVDPLRRPAYELPAHPLAKGAPFAAPGDGAEELMYWFQHAAAALARVRPALPDPGPALCWPHHFDIAVLGTRERSPEGEATRTVGVGLSPGDEGIDTPYWYVSHWPTDGQVPPAALPSGEWTTAGFTGGLLRHREIVRWGEELDDRVESFLSAAIGA